MEQHDKMFPEQKLTETEKMEILSVAVKMVLEEVAEKSKWIYQIQARQEEMKSGSALAMSDWKVDSKIALEAYVKMPKLKSMSNNNPEKKKDVLTKNTWIADSGASTHIGNSDEGMTDVKVIDSPVQLGNEATLRATKIGRKHLTVMSRNGSKLNVVLQDYKYVPDLWVNLFTLTKYLKDGWSIGNKGLVLHLRTGTAEIRFDLVILTH
jgi:hypothetical protein